MENRALEDREKLSKWLQAEIDKRGWTQAEFARQSRLTSAQVSRVLSLDQGPGLEFMRGMARAFKMPLEDVMRRAGLLPPLATEQPSLQKLIALLSEMTEVERQQLMNVVELILEFAGHYQLRSVGVSPRAQAWLSLVDKLSDDDYQEIQALTESLANEQRAKPDVGSA